MGQFRIGNLDDFGEFAIYEFKKLTILLLTNYPARKLKD